MQNLNETSLEIPKDLLIESKNINGCGPEPLNNPKSFFELACEVHDIEYSPPNSINSRHRRDADKRFLRNMISLTTELPWYKKVIRNSQAYLFFACVRMFGWYFYNKK